jgi:hypothetical protein
MHLDQPGPSTEADGGERQNAMGAAGHPRDRNHAGRGPVAWRLKAFAATQPRMPAEPQLFQGVVVAGVDVIERGGGLGPAIPEAGEERAGVVVADGSGNGADLGAQASCEAEDFLEAAGGEEEVRDHLVVGRAEPVDAADPLHERTGFQGRS